VLGSGESQREAIRPDFNRTIMIDFQGATISSDTGFILLRELDERFKIIGPMKDCLEDLRSPAHTRMPWSRWCVRGFTRWLRAMKIVTMPIFCGLTWPSGWRSVKIQDQFLTTAAKDAT